MASNSLIKGPDGERSSKRFYGGIMIGLGMFMFFALGVASFFYIPPGADTILNIGITLSASGVGLLVGGNIAENIGKKEATK